jgi:outer membrane murein-binding lipoprotein Lpp
MDPLQEFIRKNRAAFDDANPREELWQSLERRLDRQTDFQPASRPNRSREHRTVPGLVRPWHRFRLAAAAAALVLLGTAAGRYYAENSSRPDSLGDVSPEYAELEIFYRMEIHRRSKVLAASHQDRTLEADLAELEQRYEDLRRELPAASPEAAELVIQAMIANYQIRINLLETVLEKIQRTADSDQKKHPHEISL